MDEYREWGAAALTRAVKTAAQTAVALIGTGAVGFTDLDWVRIASYDGTQNATFTEHRMFASTDCPGAWLHACPRWTALRWAQAERRNGNGGRY